MNRADSSVLIVEDDESLRRILVRHLLAHGYDVEQAASAEMAERLLADGARPNVVVLDIGLPAASGWDLLQGPAFRMAGAPPVVVASALTLSPRRLSELGVAGYLAKPFALEALLEVLEHVLHSEATR